MKKTIVFLILFLIIFSTILNPTSKINSQNLYDTDEKNIDQKPMDYVLYDNGMSYSDLAVAQFDESFGLDCFQGDDFRFTQTQGFAKVKWIGGYWGQDYKNAKFSWGISFYRAAGGQGPDGHPYNPNFHGPYIFQWDDLEKTVVQDTGFYIYYELTATLPEKIYFGQNNKNYISIWAIGSYPPLSGWAYHESYKEQPCYWGSNYYNYPFWTPGIDVKGIDHDMCFQLIYENIGNLDCIGDLTFNDVAEGSWQIGSFEVKNTDNVLSYLEWEITEWPTWGGWTFNPTTGNNIPSGQTNTVVVNVKAPEKRNEDFNGEIKVVNSNNPNDYDTVKITLSTAKNKKDHNMLFLHFIDHLSNSFPLLRQLINLSN